MLIGDQRRVRRHLDQINSDLFKRFEAFELSASHLIDYAQGGSHLSFTTHGMSHVKRVELAYDWLLSIDDVDSLSGTEAFCLLCATYCHDLFMIPRSIGDENRSRAEHAKSAATELRRLQGQLGLTASETLYIGEVVKGHHVDKISDVKQDQVLGSDRLRLRMLGACLSMADICHADESRAPKIVFDYLEMSEDSARHWKRHMQIAGINRLDTKVVVSAVTFSDEGKYAVQAYVKEIENQLLRIRPNFHSQLYSIDEVQLRLEELESEFDQKLYFKTDTNAILDMLVSGVYQQTDVFIRELIQNALDATYVETARTRKNAVPYTPRVVFSEIRQSKHNLVAIRVDDNGSGMGVNEVKDTLLWIGQSQNDKEGVQEILRETGKSLIANFGIGLLSCFRVASEILIRTQKGEGGTAFELKIEGYGERVSINKITGDVSGTSVIVKLKPEYSYLLAQDVVRRYCQMVTQVEMLFGAESSERDFETSRSKVLAAAEAGGTRIESIKFPDGSINIQGDGYYCRLVIPWDKGINGVVMSDGSLTILNDGIFVCEDKSSDWLPDSLGFCSGVINFAAKSIDLPVSRDTVVENGRSASKKADIERHVGIFFEKLAQESQKKHYRDIVAIIFAHAFAKTKGAKRDLIVREVANLNVELHGGAQVPLANILKNNPTDVFITYQEGTWVDCIGRMDGIDLYSKRDQTALMQAELASSAGEIVIQAVRVDRVVLSFDRLKEKDVIEAYLKSAGVNVIDLLESTHFAGNLRSLSIPRELRTTLGRKVKFVEPNVSFTKIGWDLGNEIWLNVSNDHVKQLYENIKMRDLNNEEILALKLIVNLVDNEFDEAIRICLKAFKIH
ncbi:MAG: HD domain-containing protein [Janthinobacterium lividum]